MDGQSYTAAFEAPHGEPVLEAYPDPLTGGDPWTIGLGHTGPDVHKGARWTRDQCFHAFYNDYWMAQARATGVVGSNCWATLNVPRRAVLIDMAFQMGQSGLAKFSKMIAAVRAGDWAKAKAEMLDSDYARQLKALAPDKKTRAEHNADVMFTGMWPQVVGAIA